MIELLLNGPTIERVALPYKQALARIGITLNIRSVDSSQFITRLRSRDFDMVYTGWGESNSPGNEQLDYWGSKAADSDASQNYAGIKDPAVDTIINDIIFAKDRETQVAAVHALDRVMMAEQYVIPSYAEPHRPHRLLGPLRPSRLQEAEIRPRHPDHMVVGRGQGGQDGRRAVRRARAA